MVDSTRYKDWFTMAHHDLEGARILFLHGAEYGLVCFHCQQAIEKTLKGFLLKQSPQLMEGHSLVKLCKFCVQYHIGFNDFLKDAAFVNVFYIETRYPADEPLIVTKEDTQECLDIAQKIIEFIDSLT